MGVVVHLGGNDLGQLKGMELILWRLARFAVGVVRHSAMPGMERVQGCVTSGQGQEEGKFAVRGGIRGCCHPAPTVGGPESSVFFSGRSSSVSPED